MFYSVEKCCAILMKLKDLQINNNHNSVINNILVDMNNALFFGGGDMGAGNLIKIFTSLTKIMYILHYTNFFGISYSIL